MGMHLATSVKPSAYVTQNGPIRGSSAVKFSVRQSMQARRYGDGRLAFMTLT